MYFTTNSLYTYNLHYTPNDCSNESVIRTKNEVFWRIEYQRTINFWLEHLFCKTVTVADRSHEKKIKFEIYAKLSFTYI